MKINEDFAKYIISLMEIAILERGEEEIDRQYRGDLEGFFVQLKEEREHKEFVAWVYKNKIEADPRVIALRDKMNDENFGKGLSYGKLFAQRESLFKEFDDLRDGLAELYLQDKAVKDEWRIIASVNKMLNKKEEE